MITGSVRASKSIQVVFAVILGSPRGRENLCASVPFFEESVSFPGEKVRCRSRRWSQSTPCVWRPCLDPLQVRGYNVNDLRGRG